MIFKKYKKYILICFLLFTIFSADIKRQEHIYEFILTESNHCQVLKVIQKIFVEGMFKYLSLSKDIVDRIFPQIDTLIDLHFRFLEELRARQNQVKLTIDGAAIAFCKQVNNFCFYSSNQQDVNF